MSVEIKLNKDDYTKVLHFKALRVPKRRCSGIVKKFKGHLLDKPKMRFLNPDPENDDFRILVLGEQYSDADLSPEVESLIKEEELEVTQYLMSIDYTFYNADQILKTLLPKGVDAPGSFETVGHIAHLNLRDEQLPYRHLIGQVILDKNRNLRTIVNKVGSIENQFRVFQMEVIAGEPRLEAEVVQHGVRFKFDYEKVYWNSRLETEHKRLVGLLHRGEVLVDMMAGVGPFAIPAALHRKCLVLANDLNPHSAAYLQRNAAANRVGRRVGVFNLDAREFIRLLDQPVTDVAARQMPPLQAEPRRQLAVEEEEGKRGEEETKSATAFIALSSASGRLSQPATAAPSTTLTWLSTLAASLRVDGGNHAAPPPGDIAAAQGDDKQHARACEGRDDDKKGGSSSSSSSGDTRRTSHGGVGSSRAGTEQAGVSGVGSRESNADHPEDETTAAREEIVSASSDASPSSDASAAATLATGEPLPTTSRIGSPRRPSSLSSATSLAVAAEEVDIAAAGERLAETGGADGKLLYHHVVMNLPASAIEFLDAFGGAYDPAVWEGRLPRVHCYTFRRANETNEDIVAKAEGFLGGPLDAPADVHVVRDVAPNKIMLCVSFTVPRAVAFRGRLPGQKEGEGRTAVPGLPAGSTATPAANESREAKRQRLEAAAGEQDDEDIN